MLKHHQKSSSESRSIIHCCCCCYPFMPCVFSTMLILVFDVFGRSHRSQFVCLPFVFFFLVSVFVCCFGSFVWTHIRSSGYGSTACQGFNQKFERKFFQRALPQGEITFNFKANYYLVI